jgi:hypothetical protein
MFSAVAMVMTYIYVLAFFGGFLAIYGQFEMDGRHCITLKKVKDKVPHDLNSGKVRRLNSSSRRTGEFYLPGFGFLIFF